MSERKGWFDMSVPELPDPRTVSEINHLHTLLDIARDLVERDIPRQIESLEARLELTDAGVYPYTANDLRDQIDHQHRILRTIRDVTIPGYEARLEELTSARDYGLRSDNRPLTAKGAHSVYNGR